ncbi:MAG: class I SAM-dependent methyltransferase [Patescibacteria group bacterium]
MINSPWIRKPNFKDIKSFDYDSYWDFRGWQLRDSLKPREEIIYNYISAKSKVLDIGCGNSLLPVKLRAKNCDITVADISPKVLNAYHNLNIKTLTLDLLNFSKDEINDQFDFIILSEVLEHLPNPEEIIKKISLLSDKIIITIPNSAYFLFRLGLMFKGRFFTQWVYHPSEHLRFWSHLDFLDWLETMNLDVKKVFVSDGFTFRGLIKFLPKLWPNMFGFRMVYICSISDRMFGLSK